MSALAKSLLLLLLACGGAPCAPAPCTVVSMPNACACGASVCTACLCDSAACVVGVTSVGHVYDVDCAGSSDPVEVCR